jgi:hypothetical protein
MDHKIIKYHSFGRAVPGMGLKDGSSEEVAFT